MKPNYEMKLASSGLTKKDAKQLGIEFVPPKKLQSLLPNAPPSNALLLHYYDSSGRPNMTFFRVRLLDTFLDAAGKERRYLQPASSPPVAYFPRSIDWPNIIKDTSRSLVITEGELKAACACKHSIPCIGLGGVSSWRCKRLGWPFLPELEEIKWTGRDVVICYDSDAATKSEVAAESARLSRDLRKRGALVSIASLPPLDSKKAGIDDFIVARGAKEFKEIINNAKDDELAVALWEMNARYVLITGPDVLLDEDHKTQLNPHKAKRSALANVWAKRIDGDKVKDVLVINEWLGWPHRRDLRQFTYAPGQPSVVGDEYNLWPGWGCEPASGDIGPWVAMLDHLFSREDQEARDWFVKWLAYPLQHPGAKMATAVLLWSIEQGVGKSFTAMTMKHIYGRENYKAINQQAFEGSYTEWGRNKQFVLVDDVSSVTRKDARDNSALLKTRVTQEEITINIKYVAHYSLPDTINYFLTSNRPDALYLDPKDRRYFVHESRGGKLSEALRVSYEAWHKGDGPPALFHYLLNLDLGNFNCFTEPPLTLSKKDMIATTHTDVEAWCSSLSNEPSPMLRMDQVPLQCDLYTSTELMVLFSRQTGVAYCTPQAMGLALKGAGFERRVVGVGGESKGLYVVRNSSKWSGVAPSAWAKHYAKHNKGVRR